MEGSTAPAGWRRGWVRRALTRSVAARRTYMVSPIHAGRGQALHLTPTTDRWTDDGERP